MLTELALNQELPLNECCGIFMLLIVPALFYTLHRKMGGDIFLPARRNTVSFLSHARNLVREHILCPVPDLRTHLCRGTRRIYDPHNHEELNDVRFVKEKACRMKRTFRIGELVHDHQRQHKFVSYSVHKSLHGILLFLGLRFSDCKSISACPVAGREGTRP